MNFNYFSVAQDVIGILLALLGLKLSIIYFLYLFRQERKFKNILCLMGSIMLIISGVNLVIFNRDLRTWFISIVFLIIGWKLGKLAYKIHQGKKVSEKIN